MKLRDRFGLAHNPAPAAEPEKKPVLHVVSRTRSTPAERSYQDLKLRIHRDLIDRIDLGNIARTDLASANAELRVAIGQLIEEQAVPLSHRDREQLGQEILNEVHGLGPIEPLLRDADVCDVLVNGARQVYVERAGKLELTGVVFRDDKHLLQIIDRIVSRVGRRVDESSPMVDARLPDGSRVNAIIAPLALDGPLLSIRRFGRDPLTITELVSLGSITAELAAVLREMVRARLNILVSGGTGSGKTTLLNCLSSFIPETERIVTIEDSAELQLQQPHVCRLETRPANIEGRGEITQRELVRNTLRMRPDRIIIGECRGAETLDMLQAMNTGHDGSISTVHANSPRDALSRLETMIQMGGFDLPSKAMRQQISQALDVIVQTARLADGTRRVTSLSEVVGMEGDTIMLQELFTFEREGLEDGRIVGRVKPTGIRPNFAERMKASSHDVDASVFDYLKD
jgi:pilus assembly protein CpaF